MQPIDTAWDILKSRTIRDQSGSISGEAYGRPGKFRQPATVAQLDPPEDGPARSTRTNGMKREMDRQRKDAEQGETRDPLEMGEVEDLMDELNPRREAIAPRPVRPDPVSPEFIQQLIAEGGSFGLPPKLQQAAEEMRRKEMADKLIGMG